MLNSNPSDSNPILPPLPEFPLALVTKTSIITCTIFAALLILNVCLGNWIGASVDLAALSLVLFFSISRYKKVKQLKEQHRDIALIRQIMVTPTFREEGSSIILTFLKPSERLLKSMNNLVEEMKDSSRKK